MLTVSVASWSAVTVLHLMMPVRVGAQHCSAVPHAAVHHHEVSGLGAVADRCAAMGPDMPEFPASLGMWVVMAAAMMLPTTLPTVRSISMNGRWNRRHRSQALFVLGYLAVWSVFGAAALAVVWSVGVKTVDVPVVSGLLAGGAAWELTRRKRFFLRACHRVRALPAAANVVDYALRLIRATRPADGHAPAAVRDWVRWGAGPRAGQALVLGAKAAALLDGRAVPAPEDVTRVALPVLRHRLLVNFQAEADGITPDDVIRRLLGAVRP